MGIYGTPLETWQECLCLFVLMYCMIVLVYAKRFVKVPPDKALILFGRGKKVQKGGAAFALPIVQSYTTLPLEVYTLEISVRRIKLRPDEEFPDGVAVRMEAVSQTKIDSKKESLEKAAEVLLGKSIHEINEIALKILEASFRSVCKELTFNELLTCQDRVAAEVREHAFLKLLDSGLTSKMVNILDITILQTPDVRSSGSIDGPVLEELQKMRTDLEGVKAGLAMLKKKVKEVG